MTIGQDSVVNSNESPHWFDCQNRKGATSAETNKIILGEIKTSDFRLIFTMYIFYIVHFQGPKSHPTPMSGLGNRIVFRSICFWMNPLRVLKNGQRVDPFGYISTSLQKKLRKNVGTQEFLVFPTQGNQYHWDKKYVVACFHHISIISKALLLEFFLFIDGGEEEKVCKERRVGDGGGGQVTDCSLLHLSTKIQEEDVKDGLC